jgi:hypothetical protein
MIDQNKISELTKHYHSITPDDVVGVSIAKKRVNGQLTNEDAVVFKVIKKKPLDEIPEDEVLPSEIEFEGVKYKTDVDEGEFRLLETEYCPSAFYDWPSTGNDNRSKVRPIQGGISVTNYTSLSGSTGTLGFLAVDTDTGSLVGVSNNHVLVKNAFLASEREISGTHTSVYNNFVTQPNDGSDRGLQSSVGLVKRYVPLSGGTSYNTVDGALTTVNQSDIDGNLSYLQYGMGYTSPLEFASTVEIDSIVTNQNHLFSSGRTTGPKGEGETKLFAESIGDTITINYNNQGTEQLINFSECIRFIASADTITTGNDCFYPIAPGDSGSALVADFDGTRKIVGLVFAAGGFTAVTNNRIVFYATSGLANRIDNVVEQLSISAWTGNSVYFSDTGSTQLHTVQGLSSDINIDLSDNIYWQAGTAT